VKSIGTLILISVAEQEQWHSCKGSIVGSGPSGDIFYSVLVLAKFESCEMRVVS